MTDNAAGVTARPCRVLLVAALPQEVRPFLRRLQGRPRRGLSWTSWEFSLGQVQGLLALTGMGAEAAGAAASGLVESCRPELLISVGFGGALSPELQPGDLVLGAAYGHYEPQTQVWEALTPAPAPPRAWPELLAPLAAAGCPAVSGTLVTTPRIIHKAAQGSGLRGLANPVLDLENAAVAEVAQAANLPFLGLRAITDTADEEIPDFLVRAAGEPGPVKPREVLGWLAADPRRLKDLLHLWRRSRLAAARLAAALLVLLPLMAGPAKAPSSRDGGKISG